MSGYLLAEAWRNRAGNRRGHSFVPSSTVTSQDASHPVASQVKMTAQRTDRPAVKMHHHDLLLKLGGVVNDLNRRHRLAPMLFSIRGVSMTPDLFFPSAHRVAQCRRVQRGFAPSPFACMPPSTSDTDGDMRVRRMWSLRAGVDCVDPEYPRVDARCSHAPTAGIAEVAGQAA